MKTVTSFLFKISALVGLLTLAACGKEINKINKTVKGFKDAERDTFHVEAEFRPYFNSFMEKSRCFSVTPKLRNLVITMVPSLPSRDPGKVVNGTCTSGSNKYGKIIKDIKISKEFWDRATVVQKEKVVYHELGHCTLNLNHDEHYSDSIMSPLLDSSTDEIYISQYDHLISTTLFEGVSNCGFAFNPYIY